MTKCQKVTYETKTAALADARFIRNQSKRYTRKNCVAKAGRKLRPYVCPRCGGWHLTSQPVQRHRK